MIAASSVLTSTLQPTLTLTIQKETKMHQAKETCLLRRYLYAALPILTNFVRNSYAVPKIRRSVHTPQQD